MHANFGIGTLGIVPRVKQTGWETQRLFQPR